MDVRHVDWKRESEWLKAVLAEAERQNEENKTHQERFNKDYTQTQREMWDDVGSLSISNGLDQIVDFMQFVNTMKSQKRSHELTVKLEEKFERMLRTPYFGRMDFLEKGENTSDACYIGLSNLISKDHDFLIYDWRAPISSMFYEYEIGEAKYDCPMGSIEGELTLKRQYKIEDGEMKYLFDSNLIIEDEMLQDMLSKSADNKMKAVVTTIQREQNTVIRNETYKNLIVQGPAGSGKTSVALHRIAYLLYKHREKIKPQNIVIFSPNDIFNDYISSVLPQLGEDNMVQTTFKDYMHQSLGKGMVKEDYYQMMAYLLESKEQPQYLTRVEGIKFKASSDFIQILKNYASYLENGKEDFKDIFVNDKLIISAIDLKELYFKDYGQMPLLRRLLKLKNRIRFVADPYEKERLAMLEEELSNSETHLNKQEIKVLALNTVRSEFRVLHDEIHRLTAFDLNAAYTKLFRRLDYFSKGYAAGLSETSLEGIQRQTLRNLGKGVLKFEDQSPMLFLKGIIGDLPDTSAIKYVVIDEAQDYTPLQYEIFRQLFKTANMTILGDLNQSINPYMNLGGYERIAHIFKPEETCRVNLTKSYRSTLEITAFARGLLQEPLLAECVGRSGEAPKTRAFAHEKAILNQVLKDVETYKAAGHKSIGIITRTVGEAKTVHGFLKNQVKVKVILDDEDDYDSDTLVIPSYLSKGLEFDVVIIYNAGGENYCGEEERLLLYTACTRALHVLCVYYIGSFYFEKALA